MIAIILVGVIVGCISFSYFAHVGLIKLHLNELVHEVKTEQCRDHSLEEWEDKLGKLLKLPFSEKKFLYYVTYYEEFINKHYPHHESDMKKKFDTAQKNFRESKNKVGKTIER